MGLIALLLALVFTASGVAKLRSPRHTRRVVRAFGLPAPRATAVALPLAELATAVALVIRPRVGGLLSVALLVAFTVAILGKLARGDRNACGCFGAWSDRPLSRLDVARNGVLLAAAVVATYADPVLL